MDSHSQTGNQASPMNDTTIAPPMSSSSINDKLDDSHNMDERDTTTDQLLSHSLSPDDPANPLNWPLHRRLYASASAWAAAFAVAYGLTSYSVGLMGVIKEFDVSMTVGVLGHSLFLWGIAFAPIWSPHVAERVGRSIMYLTLLPIFSLFVLGAGASHNFASLAVCRFFAGFFGGPCLVLIEGTFADVWSAHTTNTYYAVLGLASYIGPIICGFIVAQKDWRWTQWTTLMITLAAFFLALGLPETYQREIPRRRAKRTGQMLQQLPAQSGVSLEEISRIAVVTPLIMLVSEPIVIMSSLYLGLLWGVLFQFFITIPVVLEGVYGFTVQQVGLAFIGAVVGSVMAATMSIAIEQVLHRRFIKAVNGPGKMPLEYRLIPAMIGGVGITASLFWIGWTASPAFGWRVPVLGTMVFVWGNLSVLIAIVPYLFDAYPPAGTLSALTAAACFRLAMAGLVPMVIIQMFTNLTGAWALSTFGFLSTAMLPFPFVLFFFGERLRNRSKYGYRAITGAGQ